MLLSIPKKGQELSLTPQNVRNEDLGFLAFSPLCAKTMVFLKHNYELHVIVFEDNRAVIEILDSNGRLRLLFLIIVTFVLSSVLRYLIGLSLVTGFRFRGGDERVCFGRDIFLFLVWFRVRSTCHHFHGLHGVENCCRA